MGKLKGNLRLLHDKIMVCDMNFGEEVTSSGIVLQSDNAKREGVHPRWARVWGVGPEQTDVKVGDWILVEHGRWTRGVTVVEQDGTETVIRRIDPNAILMVTDEDPGDNPGGNPDEVDFPLISDIQLITNEVVLDSSGNPTARLLFRIHNSSGQVLKGVNAKVGKK